MRQLFTICIWVIICAYTPRLKDQVSESVTKTMEAHADSINMRMLAGIEKKYHSLDKKLTAYSAGSLKRFRKLESKLQKKLAAKDSVAGKQLSAQIDSQYDQLLASVKNPAGKTIGSLKNYIPVLDSTQTALQFLEKAGGPVGKLKQLESISGNIKQLQSQLQSATAIKDFIRERKEQLQAQLDKYGLGKELKQFNKQVYYYQQQVNEYKAMINDPAKLEQKALDLLRNSDAFKDFMSKNSLLAQLFPMQGGNAPNLQGLQTLTGVQQQLSQRMAGNGGNPQQYMQQQAQQAQSELNKLKDKMNQFGGGSSDLAIPDFKPNNQKTKSFWKRIEYGLNIQSQKTNSLLPVTSDIAFTAGYKLSDKSTIGIGAGYKLGWGKNLSNIKLTSQGISLRSYVDIKLKGSIWISGGYEENYQQAFSNIDALKNQNAWQKSGLIGLTKKYKIGKKNGNLQLLWDFLSYSQAPQTQAVKFRIGYVF